MPPSVLRTLQPPEAVGGQLRHSIAAQTQPPLPQWVRPLAPAARTFINNALAQPLATGRLVTAVAPPSTQSAALYPGSSSGGGFGNRGNYSSLCPAWARPSTYVLPALRGSSEGRPTSGELWLDSDSEVD